MKKILVIEDDPATAAGIEEALKESHYEVITAGRGETGFENAKKGTFDLIILDLILPDKNGIDICKELRAGGIHTPILMLTGRKEEADKVLGLELGADDYMTKPFSVRVLLAQVRALLRRNPELQNEIEEYSFGDVYINFKNQEASKSNKIIDLSAMEFKILMYFIEHEGEVINRNTLLDDVWGYENYPSTRTVDNFILSLRKKIENDHTNPKHLLTKHRAGYKFVK